MNSFMEDYLAGIYVSGNCKQSSSGHPDEVLFCALLMQ